MSYTLLTSKIKKNVPKIEIGCKGSNIFLIYKEIHKKKLFFFIFLCISAFFTIFALDYE